MHPAFDGLVADDGTPNEIYAAVATAADALAGDPPGQSGPTLEWVQGNVIGNLTAPQGIILHSTRSAIPRGEVEEYEGTLNYVRGGANGLGWNATVGPGLVCEHMNPDQWGWNAREASSHYVAIEHAQARLGDPVSDALLDASAWYIKNKVYARWPNMPRTLVHHSELPAGVQDGKSDMAPKGSAKAEELRQRLLARLSVTE